MFFLSIGEHPLNCLAAQFITLLSCLGMAVVFGSFDVIFPNVLDDYLLVVPAGSALCQVGARCTNRRIALEHSVTIPVGRTVTQDLVVRADHAVVVIVVDIVTGAAKAFLSHRPLVGHRRVSTGIDYLLADPRGLVRRIKCECFDPWEPLHQRMGLCYNSGHDDKIVL